MDDAALHQTSKLSSWIGIAAEDKDPNSITLLVTIPEWSPALSGTIASASSNQSVQLNDINGNTINHTVTTSNTVTAYYMGNSSNRKYPPDVVRGEQLKITRFANADRYYWESLGRDDALRKTETLRLEVANRKDFADPADDDHTYSIEVDSKRNQHVRLLTSKGNGESYIYTLLLDAKNGQVQLADDVGNSITINSEKSQVIVRNTQQAFMMLNGLDASFMAPRDLTIKAGRQMLITSPLITVDTQSGAGVLAIFSTAVAVAATNSVVVTAPAIGLNGAIKIPEILTVDNIRATTYANGEVGDPYAPAVIALESAVGAVAANPADTTMPAGERHSAAWEQMQQAFAVVVDCFNQVRSATGAPTTQDTITPLVTASQMINIQGA